MPRMGWWPPDPAGGAHDAPPDSLVSWGGGHPRHLVSNVYPPIFLAIQYWTHESFGYPAHNRQVQVQIHIEVQIKK